MEYAESVVLKDEREVDRRLAELELGPRFRLIAVARAALAAGANATPFHPANAFGTFSYQEGTFALRQEFVDFKRWQAKCLDGVEVIENETLRLRVAFANVDIACNDFRKPKPRSQKGAGSERTCLGNLFGHLPEFAPIEASGWNTFYLMADERAAVELTRPCISGGTFTAYPERLYLSTGEDWFDSANSDDQGSTDEFDPLVARK